MNNIFKQNSLNAIFFKLQDTPKIVAIMKFNLDPSKILDIVIQNRKKQEWKQTGRFALSEYFSSYLILFCW